MTDIIRLVEEARELGVFESKSHILAYFNCKTEDYNAIDCDECPLAETCSGLSYNPETHDKDYDLFMRNFDEYLRPILKEKYGNCK